jgi:hypothetical protein
MSRNPLRRNGFSEDLWQATLQESPSEAHEDQAARAARDQRKADQYAQRHQLARAALGDLDWCAACGYGHVDPSLATRRLSWGHGHSPSTPAHTLRDARRAW